MRTPHWMMIAIAGISLTACDLVKFPGATPVEQPVPPPPNTGGTPIDTATQTETPLESGTPELPATEVSETSETPSELPTEGEAPPADTAGPSPFAGIDNLLSINAARCAPTSAEASLTLAEIANASRAAATNVTTEAVNGTAISADAFPGIVKMEPKRTLDNGGISSGHCGATRIANNWFVTASHCLDDTYDEIELIATQSTLSDPRAVTVTANASLCHSAYGGARGQYANDVALISISDEAAEAFSAVPIARYGSTDKPLGNINYPVARMAGWGITSFTGGELSDTLLSAELNVVSSGPAIVTVASRETAGPCIGDSGGPLMIDEADGAPKVIGVLSVVEQNRETGAFCEGDYNARYTNLQGYIDWIDSVIGVCTASPELCAR